MERGLRFVVLASTHRAGAGWALFPCLQYPEGVKSRVSSIDLAVMFCCQPWCHGSMCRVRTCRC